MSSALWTLRRGLPLLTIASLAVGLSTLSAREERTPKKYAVLVGVGEYQHPDLPTLRYTENDATEMAALLAKHGYEVKLLCDSQGKKDGKLAPTRANIEREIKGILDKAKKGDLVLVGLSGHGLQFRGDKDGFFCPSDARPSLRRKETLVSLGGIYKQMDDSFAGAKVLLVDACRDDPTAERGTKGIDADNAPRPPRGRRRCSVVRRGRGRSRATRSSTASSSTSSSKGSRARPRTATAMLPGETSPPSSARTSPRR